MLHFLYVPSIYFSQPVSKPEHLAVVQSFCVAVNQPKFFAVLVAQRLPEQLPVPVAVIESERKPVGQSGREPERVAERESFCFSLGFAFVVAFGLAELLAERLALRVALALAEPQSEQQSELVSVDVAELVAQRKPQLEPQRLAQQ